MGDNRAGCGSHEHASGARAHRKLRGDRAASAALALRCAAALALARPARGGVAADGDHRRSQGGELRLGDAGRLGQPARQRRPPTTSSTARQGLRRADAIADAGAGTKAVSVSLPVAGLQPLTVYHYRLVAVNAAAPRVGADRTFVDDEGAAVARDPVLPQPRPLRRHGQRSGHAVGHRTTPTARSSCRPTRSPSRPASSNVGNPELTTATGSFTFTLLGAATTDAVPGRDDHQPAGAQPGRDRERRRAGLAATSPAPTAATSPASTER